MHNNEPRDIGYSINSSIYYQELTEPNANSMFAGKRQKDLFIFAMALGKYSQRKLEIGSKKQNNIPTSAIPENQKWALLPILVSETNDLLSLRDEGPAYKLAEEYANEGIEILRSRLETDGVNYPKKLELTLKKILENEG